MSETTDYLANREVEEGDKVDYGVPGMKWGIRNGRGTAKAKSSGDAPLPKKPDGPETSAERYARIAAHAKAGKAKDLDDDDLKFFNARTEAIAKINKLNSTNPNWLKKTADEVVKNVAKKQIQTIADSLASKHVSGPIVEAITAKQKAANAEAIKKGVEAGVKNAITQGVKQQIDDGVQKAIDKSVKEALKSSKKKKATVVPPENVVATVLGPDDIVR